MLLFFLLAGPARALDFADRGWNYYVMTWSEVPALISTTTEGRVYSYVNNGVTRYRFVPSPYLPTGDAFYNSFEAGQLSGLLATRGNN